MHIPGLDTFFFLLLILLIFGSIVVGGGHRYYTRLGRDAWTGTMFSLRLAWQLKTRKAVISGFLMMSLMRSSILCCNTGKIQQHPQSNRCAYCSFINCPVEPRFFAITNMY